MDYWLLRKNLFFSKIKIRSRYLNFSGQILTTTEETHFIPAVYFDVPVTGFKAERLSRHQLLLNIVGIGSKLISQRQPFLSKLNHACNIATDETCLQYMDYSLRL